MFSSDLLRTFQKCDFISFLCLVQNTKFVYQLRNFKIVVISNCLHRLHTCLQWLILKISIQLLSQYLPLSALFSIKNIGTTGCVSKDKHGIAWCIPIAFRQGNIFYWCGYPLWNYALMKLRALPLGILCRHSRWYQFRNRSQKMTSFLNFSGWLAWFVP